jgi:hypothetical protein
MNRLAGSWHQVASLASSKHHQATPCMSLNLSSSAGNQFQVTFTHAASTATSEPNLEQGSSTTGPPVQQVARGYIPDTASPGKLELVLSQGPRIPLWLVDTDYDSWALLYACSLAHGSLRSDQAFLLMSRNPSMMDPLDLGDCLNRVADLGLPWQHVSLSDVQRCT